MFRISPTDPSKNLRVTAAIMRARRWGRLTNPFIFNTLLKTLENGEAMTRRGLRDAFFTHV